MLAIVLTLVLVSVAAGILFALSAAILQGYWYSSTIEGIGWRSTAAGGAIGIFFALWCAIEGALPGRFDSLFGFSPRESVYFDQIWSVRKNDRGTQEILYRKSRSDRGTIVYVDSDQRPWQRSDNGVMVAIIVEENGERKRFDADLDAKGQFRVTDRDPARYVEVGGSRVMTETALGQIHTMRYGLLIGNLFWNALHLAVWFACFWLLMQFQWPHALLLGAGMWLLSVVVVWPMLQERIRIAAGR